MTGCSLFPFLSFDLPDKLLGHVKAWLTSNQRQPEEIRWSLFPLGMVNGWISRAEESEAVIAYVHGLIEHGEWCLDNCTCKHYVGMREATKPIRRAPRWNVTPLRSKDET